MRAWRAWALSLIAACGRPPAKAPAVPGYLVYVRDRAGSVIAAIDDRGKTLSTTTDDGFGLRLSSTGTPVPREFLDQDRDDETGYYHFRRRYYDPATAQWISPDPKLIENPDCSGRVQGCNPYAFAGNRPTEWTDPDGREVTTFVDAWGRQTLLITAGFYGPQAALGQQLFNAAMYRFNGELRVIATTAVYKSAAEIPNGITKINADMNHLQQGSGYRGSDTDQQTSLMALGADALDRSGNARWASIIQHETLHLAGLIDSYSTDAHGQQLNDPPSQKGSVMARIYDVPSTRLTARDIADIANPPVPPNQGMTVSTGDFGPGASLQTIDTYSR
jgi:RHS repeat-associated protein